MKILVYSHRKDEAEYFNKFSEKYNAEIVICKDEPSFENVSLAKGFDCISIITTPINSELMKKFYDVGVKFISTRTIGYDHIDMEKAKELGMKIANVTYSPSCVADYTVMMILMATRKIKAIMQRSNVQDYSLTGVQGVELHNLTVGVIGTGKIGCIVITRLSTFGCKLLAYNPHHREELKQYAEYVELQNLIENSDIITLHIPATSATNYMINKSSIEAMKDGVFIINTARGSLINTEDLIDGIENGKIGGAALDVIENETNLYYNDLECEILNNRELAILNSYSNVIVTPYTAFYTDQAISDQVENSILSCTLFMKEKENPWEIKNR